MVLSARKSQLVHLCSFYIIHILKNIFYISAGTESFSKIYILTLKMRTKSKETEFVYLNLYTSNNSMYVGNRHFTKVLQINCSITYYFNPMYDNIPFNAISVVSCMAYDSYNLHPLAADKFLCSPNHFILGNALFIFLCYFQTLN